MSTKVAGGIPAAGAARDWEPVVATVAGAVMAALVTSVTPTQLLQRTPETLTHQIRQLAAIAVEAGRAIVAETQRTETKPDPRGDKEA